MADAAGMWWKRVAFFSALFLTSGAAAQEPEDRSCLEDGCHGMLLEARFPHPPAEEGLCDICHEEQGDHDFAIAPDICAACHDVAEVGEERQHRSCTACHEPHAGGPSLLREEPPDLCMSCHQRSVRSGERNIAGLAALFEGAEVIHPPAEDDCGLCHDPHALDRASYLAGPFPQGPYAAYRAETYVLCFDCHDDVLEEETGFRNGEINLHRVHVGGERGRTCLVCHDPHGAGPHLLRADRRYGSWQLPIRFEPSSEGGSCRPGCHEPRSYR